MTTRRYIVSGFAACMALAASAGAIGWLIKSADHTDRPPLFAIVALLFAIVAGTAGLVLAVRTATRVARLSRHNSK